MAKVNIDDIYRAERTIRPYVHQSPVVRLAVKRNERNKQITLKLESLQPVGSFKLRGAAATILSLDNAQIRRGLLTVSTGNFGQAVAYMASQFQVPCHVIVPDHVPHAKMAGVRRHGGHVVREPWEQWWRYITGSAKPDLPGVFVHPEEHDEILAGNGTVGLEILAQCPDVEAVFIPYGGGGLTAGIGTAIKALRPDVRIYACEVETAAPLTAALRNKEPTDVEYTPSFVDGIGCHSVLPAVWDVVKNVVDGTFILTLDEIRSAMQVLADRSHVIAEGAGAVSVAASLYRDYPETKVACVVSGGNIDLKVFTNIVAGRFPKEKDAMLKKTEWEKNDSILTYIGSYKYRNPL